MMVPVLMDVHVRKDEKNCLPPWLAPAKRQPPKCWGALPPRCAWAPAANMNFDPDCGLLSCGLYNHVLRKPTSAQTDVG